MNNYVLISITGKNPQIFIKRLHSLNIEYKSYNKINYKNITLKLKYIDYLKIYKISSIYKIEIIRYYGLLKYKMLISRNVNILISFIISFIIILILSNTIFDIDVIHNDKNIRNLILEELKENKIDTFKLVPNFKQRFKIKERIIKNNKNIIEWLEIKRVGSKIIVKVTERRTNEKQEIFENRDVVAKKSGIILKIDAQKGVVQKKINDYVLKGDTIISGNIIKDETVKGQIPAQGKVYAETWYKVHVSYPLIYNEIIYLNDVKNNYIIKFFNTNISLKSNYKESEIEKKKILLKENIFPFMIYKEKQRKVKIKKEKLSNSDASKKAILLAENKIKLKLSKDEYIISKKALNFSTNNSRIDIDVFFKVYEDITDYKKLDPIVSDTPINE